MPKATAYVSHADCSLHDAGWGHPEHQGRLPAVARAVYRDMLTLFEPLLQVEARPAAVDDLLLAHTSLYVERVRRATGAAREAGTPLPFEGGAVVSGASWEAALAAVGSALTAVEVVLAGEARNAFCPVRPPGHEVGVDRSRGFGLFNSAAVAARHLRERRGMERVLVLDVSSSGGLGTAEIVAADPGIRFSSVHATREEPAAWPDAARVARLPAGAGGAELVAALDAALDEAVSGFVPDFLLLSIGFDALASDPLGSLSLRPGDYFELTRCVRERADVLCGGCLVSVMEGGYDADATGRAVVQHLRALAGLPAGFS